MATATISKNKIEIIEIGRRLWERGMVAANDGNISCRLTDGYLITKSGVSKGSLCEADILHLDANAQPIDPHAPKPSIETALHLAIYANDPAVQAIVHAHPPYATAFALAGHDINSYALEELRVQLGRVALIPYAPAGSCELAQVTAQHMHESRAGLMLRHGAITVGDDLMQAFYRMEALEQSARIIAISQSLQRP